MTMDALCRSTSVLPFHRRTISYWTDVCGFNVEDDSVKKQHTKIVTLSTISDDCWKVGKLRTFIKPRAALGNTE